MIFVVSWKVISPIQERLGANGADVERDVGRALHFGWLPFARLCDDGLAILVPGPLVGDPEQARIIERWTARPAAGGQMIAGTLKACLA